MRTLQVRRILGVLLLLVPLVACESGSDAPATSGAAPADPATLAAEAVARQLDLPVTAVTTVSVEAVEFTDSSLGCPEPGMAYMQVITPGHKIVVEADGRRFDVRVAGRSAKICHRRKPGASPERQPRSERTSQATRRAREQLAKALDIDPERINVARVAPVRGDTRLPGCTVDCSPGDCGTAIELEADGRRYLFHARGDRVTACPPIARS